MSSAEFDSFKPVFPRWNWGNAIPVTQLRSLITATWLLSVECRALIEDISGGAQQPELLQIVKLNFIELLQQIDWLLLGKESFSNEHALAAAFEYGFCELTQMRGQEVMEWLLVETELGAEDVNVERVVAFWQLLLENFPGKLPDPTVPTGQSEILVALRNWTRICDSHGVDSKFLADLLKSA